MMKTILNAITGMLSLHPSPSEERIREFLANTYDNVEVVGRSTIYIDPQEVANCPEYKKMCRRLDEMIAHSKRTVLTPPVLQVAGYRDAQRSKSV